MWAKSSGLEGNSLPSIISPSFESNYEVESNEIRFRKCEALALPSNKSELGGQELSH